MRNTIKKLIYPLIYPSILFVIIVSAKISQEPTETKKPVQDSIYIKK